MLTKLSALMRSLGVAVLIIAPLGALAEDRAPEVVVTELLAAMEEGNAADIRAAFSEEASQAYGSGAAQTGAAFRTWLESDIIAAEGRVENAELSVDGKNVIVTGRYRNANGYSSAANFLMTVEDRLITRWQMRY